MYRRGSLPRLGAWRGLLDRFRSDENGSGTVFSVFGVLICLVLAGSAIDITNAWRNRELMKATADAAAHAGLVALVQGYEKDMVLERAKSVAEINMPYARFGPITFETVNSKEKKEAFALRHYDTRTNSLVSFGAPNAVVVTLERSRRGGNPVPTFLLRLVGFNYWDIAARGVAVAATTKRCNTNDGIFARGKITLASQNKIGAGFCLHSQDAVWLPQNNTFESGSWVSVPNLEECRNKCTDVANPGIRAISANMILADLDPYIDSIYSAFTGNDVSNLAKTSFFLSRSLDTDLSAIDEIGIKTEELKTGDIVELSPMQFSRMRELPAGLTYKVTCAQNGSGKNTVLQFGGIGAEFIMEDAALMTNCSINFGDRAKVVGSLIVTTREQNTTTISADSGVLAGDPAQTCNTSQRTIIMSKSKLSVPADFTSSNVTLVVGDDVTIAAMPGSSDQVSKGLSIHANGQVQIAAGHTFESCKNKSSNLIPRIQVIRLVTPTGDT